jgi:hypothetical protein
MEKMTMLEHGPAEAAGPTFYVTEGAGEQP